MEFQLAITTILLIVAIVFPGIIFRRTYYSNHFSKQFYQGSFSDRLIITVFIGFFCQIFTLIIYYKIVPFEDQISLKIFKNFFFGIPLDAASVEKLVFNIPVLKKLIYLLFLSFVTPLAFGFLSHNAIRILRLDIKLKALRFTNYWYYYQTGEILKTKDLRKETVNKELLDLGVKDTYVDLLVIEIEEPVIYQGKWFQYTISKDSNLLDEIFISNVKKKKSGETFKEIDCNIMHIPYSSVVNMGIRYFHGQPSDIDKNFQIIYTHIAIWSLIITWILPWLAFREAGFIKIILGIVSSNFGILLIMAAFVLKFMTPLKFKDLKPLEINITFGITIFIGLLFIILSGVCFIFYR
tara:strand:- start:477 stop:1532 length:1056 start_codon:yes stop_codon:yes gene_type:complete